MGEAVVQFAPRTKGRNAPPEPPVEPGTLDAPVIRHLIKLIRAQDTHGVWEKRSDASLLGPYIVSREQRRLLPVMGDPDEATVRRVETFYGAVGLAIEAETGIMVAPLMKLHHEGFGRVVLTAGHLVALSKHLREVHRFGFESVEKLAAEGAKLVAQGVAMIRKYPEVAEA
jgi:probable nitrogen fixation protein